jgi:hypothetical protein
MREKREKYRTPVSREDKEFNRELPVSDGAVRRRTRDQAAAASFARIVRGETLPGRDLQELKERLLRVIFDSKQLCSSAYSSNYFLMKLRNYIPLSVRIHLNLKYHLTIYTN